MKKLLLILGLLLPFAGQSQIVRVVYVSADTAYKIDSGLTANGYSCYFFMDTLGNWLFPVDSYEKGITKRGGTIVNVPYDALKDKRPVPYKFTR